MRIIANRSILHNNTTNCTFIASEVDEQVQTGTRENDFHIEWMGDLNFSVPSQEYLNKLEARNKELEELALPILEYFDRGLSDIKESCGEEQPMLKEIKYLLTLIQK